MKCTYCGRRVRSENTGRFAYANVGNAMIAWETPNPDDWMCEECQTVARRIVREHIAEIGELVLAALKAQGGKA